MGSFLSKIKSKKSPSENETKETKMATPIAMNYFEKAQSTFKPPLIANENAFLGDIATR